MQYWLATFRDFGKRQFRAILDREKLIVTSGVERVPRAPRGADDQVVIFPPDRKYKPIVTNFIFTGVGKECCLIYGNGSPLPRCIIWPHIRTSYAPDRSEEHTSELKSLIRSSYAGLRLKTITKQE